MRRFPRTFAAACSLLLALPLAATWAPTATAANNPTTTAAKRATASEIAQATPGDFTGYGFDQCLAPTQRSMNRWWRSSPFTAVGIYVSGDSRACRDQPNLSQDWVARQVAKGWRLLPIALGPQASCQPRFPRYDDDFRISARPKNNYAKARRQGRVEADKNAADALSYGIGPGSTLWYDLEGFDLGKRHCRESALAFVSSWTKRIKRKGYVAGMYSSASSGIKMVDDARRLRPGQFHLPDRLWIARWDGIPNTSTTYIPEDGWRPGGRMKQYRGGHNEKWGGVTINIDSNFIDLGAGSQPVADNRCGTTRITFRKYPTLTPGLKRPRKTKALQCLLKGQGHYRGPLDGAYDADVVAAARTWQEASGFAASDTFAKPHWVALLADGPRTVAKRGSVGTHVHRVQGALNAAIDARLKRTGVLDTETEAALRRYQASAGMKVSGSVTPQTWNRLQRGRG